MFPRLHRNKHKRSKGFVMIAAAFAVTALAGITGLAVDLGRMYIAKNELQTYVDAGALAAALEINGESSGVTAAQTAATSISNQWDFASKALQSSQVTVAFATGTTATTWVTTPDATQAKTHVFVRVRASVPLKLYLIPAVQGASSTNVEAFSIAGRQDSGTLASGYAFPFSPIAPSAAAADFGFVKGNSYALRWASNIDDSGAPPNGSTCAGDLALGWASGSTIATRRAGPSSTRGYIEAQSGSQLDDWIDNGMDVALSVNGTVFMATGSKNGRKNAMGDRVDSDTDHTTTTFTAYENNRSGGYRVGSGKRIVVVPVNDGTAAAAANGNGGPENRTIKGFAAFFLNDLSYDDTAGNEPYCAEYIGSYVQGANSHSGGGTGGVAKVRLVK